MSAPIRALGALSALETVSVAILLVNLVTVHDPGITRVLGPAHGALYLAVAVTAAFARGLSPVTRICAFLPVLSGPLTVVNLRRERARAR
ncbi:hypothetical protein GCM10009551_101770 [Nocardiopsis tropica]|uniref:hypothetical protein n=1 Tax=Tsukamurella strandjordii TaxID=147577 RepID=UPI0031D2FDAC